MKHNYNNVWDFLKILKKIKGTLCDLFAAGNTQNR